MSYFCELVKIRVTGGHTANFARFKDVFPLFVHACTYRSAVGVLPFGGMAANVSYPLVPCPPQQQAIVPISSALVPDPELGDDREAEADLLAFLWWCFCQLALLFWLAVLTIRHLQRQVIELRCQANYWRAQHQGAVQRAAVLAAQVQHLEAEIREWKRRFFGRKSETSSATQAQAAKTSGHSTAKDTK